MPQAIVKTYNSKEALENARTIEAAATTYQERFYTLMKLIKISRIINNAKIIHFPTMNNPI